MAEKQTHSLRRQGIGMIAGLALQYTLGIFTALFVRFPESSDGAQLWRFAWTQLSLVLHIILGVFLLFGTIALAVRAVKMKDRTWVISSAVSIAAVLIAIIAGSIFVPTQSDAYSFIMALAYIIALFSYAWGLYASPE